MGTDISTSMKDFDSYIQSHQGSGQQESNLSDKLDDSLLSESVTSLMWEKQLDAGCVLTDLETSNQLEDTQGCVKPCFSSTPVKDTRELANDVDSGVHSSNGEINSFNESKELVRLYDPTSLLSQLVILDLETVPKEWDKGTSSRFPDFKCSKETSCKLLDFKCIKDGVLINKHLTTSLAYRRIMELLMSQGCKNPLKGSGLV